MTSKLTKKESAWFDEVNAVLARCPSPEKFGFYTIGDPNWSCRNAARTRGTASL
ncbi:hypothetical protein PGN89_17170 [Klebsiella aerogenes]